MLVALSVQRIALIESLELNVSQGLCAFTGETGAGKSILLDAIGLLLGNRATAELIRSEAESAVVEALFQLEGPIIETVNQLLTSWGMDESNGEMLVSRELFRSGRNACRINGRMATVQMLRTLGERLVQQHGQHDHQGLLFPDEQLRLLDLYAHHGERRESVEAAYDNWIQAKSALESAQIDEQERVRRLDMLSFQIEEIEQAALRVGEETDLQELRRRLQHADKITTALSKATDALHGRDRHPGVVELLASAAEQAAAAHAYSGDLAEAMSLLETAQVHADEATRLLFKHLQQVNTDPVELEQVETRLTQIRGLERKYGPTEEDVLLHLQNCQHERMALLRHEEQLEELTNALQNAERALMLECDAIHESRVRAATALGEQVQQVLRELNMPHGTLEVQVQWRVDGDGQKAYRRDGADFVVFLFSANKGEAPKPLNKIASGGELSRTLLAIKAVLAEVDDISTLIFDEIDTGVSGNAAHRIADQLLKLGSRRQVLCVTHSAQIAAAAHAQYCIEKVETHDRTVTRVNELDHSGRIAEVARLLGSALSDNTAFDHAEALLHRYEDARATFSA